MLPSVAEEAIRVKDGWFQKGVTVKLDGAQATYWFDLRQVIVAEPPSRAARMIAWHRGDQDGVIEDR